ncbi:hypothetical protein LTR36_010455 [Oleoguttula mirabilis]|uniref:F-box domain-containing protein n=1 Tax=Oleoguttula mirabilis TaxID=1507867 RepID=A0AAV9J436_9PEZI|nr:hypothetical protein LTR36_010455 [Oleoguttula mirabilis]
MATTAATVFAVPELLEAVLLELPAQDLLLATRVNTTFRNAIGSSVRIQRALFFTPTPVKDSQAEPRINPLIDRILNLHLDALVAGTDCPFRSCRRSPHVHIQGNHVQPVKPKAKRNIDNAITTRGSSPAVPPPPSWQRMLVTDPPCPIDAENTFGARIWEVANMGELVQKLDVRAAKTVAQRAFDVKIIRAFRSGDMGSIWDGVQEGSESEVEVSEDAEDEGSWGEDDESGWEEDEED